MRDLRILAQPLGGNAYHFRDATGLETDAIVELPEGRWTAVEVKLGGAEAVEAAARSLIRLRQKVEPSRVGKPRSARRDHRRRLRIHPPRQREDHPDHRSLTLIGHC